MPTHDHHDGDATIHGAGAAAAVPSTGPSRTTIGHVPHASSTTWLHWYAARESTEATKTSTTVSTGHAEWATVWQQPCHPAQCTSCRAARPSDGGAARPAQHGA